MIDLKKIREVIDNFEPGLLDYLELTNVDKIDEERLVKHLIELEERDVVTLPLLHVRLKAILNRVNGGIEYLEKEKAGLVERQFNLQKSGAHSKLFDDEISMRENAIKALKDRQIHLSRFVSCVDKAKRRVPL